MREDLTAEDVHEAADRLVEDLLDAAGQMAPPVDVIRLAQSHLGLSVCLDRREGKPRRRPARGTSPTQVFLDPGAPADRQNWAVARAVAVHLKPDFVHALGVPPEQKGGLWGESLTTLIAQRLLLPTRWFAADARSCAYDLEELKRRYGTAGHEVIGWRLLDLPAPCVITVVENDHVSHRKSNAWRVPRDLSRPERECQQYVSYYSRARVVRQEGWTVQGWPVHQPDWKREVLRSVLDVADLD